MEFDLFYLGISDLLNIEEDEQKVTESRKMRVNKMIYDSQRELEGKG